MTLANRIKKLRRRNDLSEAELAYLLKVSKEDVMKWENDIYPNLDEIKSLSEVFNVSCDYLINGKEKDETDARIFFVVGSFLNFVGLMVSLMIWFEEQSVLSVPTGLMIMAVGCMVYYIGQFVGNHKKEASFYFWLINIWFLSLIPIAIIFNFIQSVVEGYFYSLAPLPMVGNNGFGFILCWIFYFAICILFDIILLKRK